MSTGHDPDDIDPTDQSGKPVLVTGLVVGLLLVLAVLVVVYFLSS